MGAPGLLALDARLAEGGSGTLLVRAGNADVAHAVTEHIVRRARTTVGLALSARARSGSPLWHDVLLQLQPHADGRAPLGGRASGSTLPTPPAASVERLVVAARGRRVVVVAPLPPAGSWDRHVALELGAQPSPFLVVFVTEAASAHPYSSAGNATNAANATGVIRAGRIGEATAHEVDAGLGAETFDVGAGLTLTDRERWWSVLAESAAHDLGDLSLATLELWWSHARRGGAPVALSPVALPPVGLARVGFGGPSVGDAAARELSAPESALLTALVLAGRPWLTSEVTALGSDVPTALALAADGFVRQEGGWLTLNPRIEAAASTTLGGFALDAHGLSIESAESHASGASGASDRRGASSHATPESARRVATALLAIASRTPADPWAYARAAELCLFAGDVALADAAMEQALTHVEETVARADMTGRWASAVAGCATRDRVFLQSRAAERALAVGEADEAHRWARAASAAAPDEAAVTLLLGRSLVALGDLVAAEVTLQRGQRIRRDHVEERGSGKAAPSRQNLAALLAVELAEVAYLKGDMVTAGRGAADALTLAASRPDAREAVAKARNTLGKILLAEAKWDEADRHFAEDALNAAAHGDLTSELRARLNRGIAFLSNGALDEARSIFEAVRSEGERMGDFRASAFALDNLAVVATWRHDYAEALVLSERTLKLRQRLGDRLTTARIVGNLAELRRKLGLLEHAEHAIVFGRRALGPGMPPERSAHFSFVAARVALDRGQTEVAHREIRRAIQDAELAGHRKILAEAHRVSTRIALEDGDLTRARASLEASRELSVTDEARAEVALLDAVLARATGEDALDLGLTALALARAVGEEEGLLEAHLLLGETYRGRGNLDAARSHLAQGFALRDQVTVGLPPDVVAAFLARRDVAQLPRLEAQLLADASERTEVASLPAASGSRPSFLPPLPANAPGSSAGSSSASSTGLAGGLGRGEGSRRPSMVPGPPGSAPELVGSDPLMRGLQATIKKVAGSSSTVLIRGESGTGKELVAAALHRASARAAGPMVTVNCAALVETLLLSELFGHEKGAFTGASGRRRGRFELAEGGTLFLDEIGDISPKTQVALLRVLQERTFERVGGTVPIHVDVHIICATHRDLRAMVERGEFREDLYYRLRGITLDVPALRARTGDLPALADHLLGRIADERGEPKKYLSSSAKELLALHAWPGNVRELENALRAASLFADTDRIGAAHLTDNVDDLRITAGKVAAGKVAAAHGSASRPSEAHGGGPRGFTEDGEPRPTLRAVPSESSDIELACRDASPAGDATDAGDAAGLDAFGPLPEGEASATAVAYAQVRQGALSLSDLKRQIERDCIARALLETRGNITKAASLLGMKRPRLSQLVKQYGLAGVTSEVT